jgi:hypothetical protein
MASRSVSPSPATYKVEAKVMSPRWTFGSSERKGIINRIGLSVPGPGQYDVSASELVLRKGPSFTMKSRARSLNHDPGPGPAAYGEVYSQFD